MSSVELMTLKKSSESRKKVHEKRRSAFGGKGHTKDVTFAVCSAHAKNFCIKDKVLASKYRSGELSAHDFAQCTAVAEKETKEREISESPF